jgi:hypothetical protein
MSHAARTLLLCAVLAAAGGCDYFKPTQPEPPSNAQSFVPNYSSPDSTLATIARSIEDKGITIGGVAYGQAFAAPTSGSPSAYQQFFDPIDLAGWQSVTGRQAPEWGYDLEQTFYRSFVRLRNDHYVCTWAQDQLNPDSSGTNPDFIKISRHYLVVSTTQDGQQTSFIAIGFADLYFLRYPDSAWRITAWKDRRDPNADPKDPEQQSLGRRRLNTTS